MQSITEFLSTKVKNEKCLPNDATLRKYVETLFAEVYDDKETTEGVNKLVDKFMEIADKNKFNHVRVFGSCREVNQAIVGIGNYDVATYFDSLVKKELHYDCIEDAKDNNDDAKEITANDYYTIAWTDYFIYIENYAEDGILFEKHDTGEDNPKLSTYYDNRTEYVELSNRPLQSEIENIPYDEDGFWVNYKEFCDDYISILKENTGIEAVILGRNGKHLCAKATMNLIHNYDNIIATVKDLQDKLKADLQDEADYWNDESEQDEADYWIDESE